MSRPVGLRTQLSLGLVIIIVVATLSVGAITAWATRWQLEQREVASARLLARGMAHVVARELAPRGAAAELASRGAAAAVGCLLEQLVLWDGVRGVRIYRRDGSVLASRGAGQLQLDEARVGLSAHSGVPLVQQQGDALQVASAVVVAGQVEAVLVAELVLGDGALGWPVLFWLLMGLDGLALLLFVSVVLTRHVVRPVVRMQQAALRVIDGDLSARVEPVGAMELTSLAESFNSMTRSMEQQLQRLERQRLQLLATREQVIRSEKLASVGRLAAGVAHEVGNPLQSIVGYTEMLLRPGPEEQRRDFLERVSREAQRIQRIVRELLDYARPVEDEVEPVSVALVVEQALQLVRPQRRMREVEVTLSGLEAVPAVAANSSRLVQVVVNLLLNAADACEPGGAVRVEVEVDGDQVQLAVENDGAPIPPADRGRIFDPFFTTKDPGEGTGLGLSVAQSIVESYGGRLLLAETERTRFLIRLAVYRSSDGG